MFIVIASLGALTGVLLLLLSLRPLRDILSHPRAFLSVLRICVLGLPAAPPAAIRPRPAPPAAIPPPPAPSAAVRRLPDKVGFAALCNQAYDDPHDLQLGSIVGPWTLLAIHDEGAIWLWADDRDKPAYAVVLRGTTTVSDASACCQLVRASLSDSVAGWTGCADSKVLRVAEILAHHGIDPSTHRITCAGHSLGASYAEFLLHRLRSQRGGSSPLHDAITFDSPGLPVAFRRQERVPDMLIGLTTIMASASFINTLNAPLAETVYTCGRGSSILLEDVARVGWSLISQGPEAAFSLCYQRTASLEEHRMRSIFKAVETGHFMRSSPELWARNTWSPHVARSATAVASALSRIRATTSHALSSLSATIAQAAVPMAEPGTRKPEGSPTADLRPSSLAQHLKRHQQIYVEVGACLLGVA